MEEKKEIMTKIFKFAKNFEGKDTDNEHDKTKIDGAKVLRVLLHFYSNE